MNRLVAVLVACMIALPACAPGRGLRVSMRESAVDITFGGPRSTPAPRPPRSGLGGSTFPGFIVPPVLIDEPAPSPEPSLVADCPVADPFGVPAVDAGSAVDADPREGGYVYRRVGYVQSVPTSDPGGQQAVFSAPKQPMAPAVVRAVRNVRHETGATPRLRYDLVQTEGSLTTTTTYVVDNTSGLYVERIVTEREDLPGGPAGRSGVETFQPQPMIKIANLPLQREGTEGGAVTPAQQSHGTDPLTGIVMDSYFQTVGHERVDACGSVLDAWTVKVHGSFQRPNVRQYTFAGDFAFAPQFGGLIVRDHILIGDGRDDTAGVFFQQESDSTVNAPDPEEP